MMKKRLRWLLSRPWYWPIAGWIAAELTWEKARDAVHARIRRYWAENQRREENDG